MMRHDTVTAYLMALLTVGFLVVEHDAAVFLGQETDFALTDEDTSGRETDRALMDEDTSGRETDHALMDEDTSGQETDRALMDEDTSGRETDHALMDEDTSVSDQITQLTRGLHACANNEDMDCFLEYFADDVREMWEDQPDQIGKDALQLDVTYTTEEVIPTDAAATHVVQRAN
ncbi:uncharacterized protein LOC119735126 isoform X3 [Patiria miniata]|uniref:Uncharacterized protein n=1 Tax=Patiria miniata TaxID=46514 RepID=A0A914AMK7_PATMI|nr:uncharacterized protein LOC119735126 isoform X3 [Patiria miniata]